MSHQGRPVNPVEKVIPVFYSSPAGKTTLLKSYFDAGQVSKHEDVLEAFLNQGARLFEAYNNDDTIPGGRLKNHVMLFADKINPPITVFKKEAESLKGNWAHNRLSWGDPDEFQRTMKEIMSLADSTGCRVYDAQIEEFFEAENMENVMVSVFEGASRVRELFGSTNSN
jgi:hypothetical protein